MNEHIVVRGQGPETRWPDMLRTDVYVEVKLKSQSQTHFLVVTTAYSYPRSHARMILQQ